MNTTFRLASRMKGHTDTSALSNSLAANSVNEFVSLAGTMDAAGLVTIWLLTFPPGSYLLLKCMFQ